MPALQKIVEGCNADIRQTLQSIEMIKASQLRNSEKFKNKEEMFEGSSGLIRSKTQNLALLTDRNPLCNFDFCHGIN